MLADLALKPRRTLLFTLGVLVDSILALKILGHPLLEFLLSCPNSSMYLQVSVTYLVTVFIDFNLVTSL